jgi:hypothetical protein
MENSTKSAMQNAMRDQNAVNKNASIKDGIKPTPNPVQKP